MWHILNVFQGIMSVLAGPLLIGISIWLYYEIRKKANVKSVYKFDIWAIAIIVFSFFVEAIGVRTGRIFGEYNYGDTLWPQFFGVPISISFAWFLMLICSIALMQRLPVINTSNIWIKIFVVSILMTFFDFMMEPAAVKLNYWNWKLTSIPIQNYLAWFVLSYIFIVFGQRMGVLKIKMPILVTHAFFAQLLYFIMIMFK